MPESLSLVTKDTIGKFFARCRDCEMAYADGHTCASLDKALKQYKSHRRVAQVSS